MVEYIEKAKSMMEGPVLPIPEVSMPEGVTLRYTVPQDAVWLKKWLSLPEAMNAYPMCTEMEIDDAARRWISFSRLRSSLTIEANGIPVGIVTLHIHWYKRLSHQCDFAIIVHPEFRGNGFGGFLLSNALRLAKSRFKIDLLHLQVYADNPAVKLYSRYGFEVFGCHPAWIKDGEKDYVRVLYMGRKL